MAELSLKQQFVRLLRDILIRSGVRQKDLVRHLGISASAMSQMLSGLLIPTPKRLDQMFELLRPRVEDAEKLQHMIYWLRSGRNRMPSGMNRRLFMLRCQRGLSVSQLSAACGISEARLRRLERFPSVRMSVAEEAALAEVFGCSDGYLSGKSGYEQSVSLPLEASDAHLVSLPSVDLEELREYAPPESIGRFVFSRARRFLQRAALPPEALAAVCAPAEQLRLALAGEVELILGDERPKGFLKLELCHAVAGGFFIRGESGMFHPEALGRPCEDATVKWSVPVLEVCYMPKV